MKESIEPDVVLAIKQLVTNEEFAKEIKSRIGTEIDTTEVDREIKNYESNLRQVENNKRRLESDIDSLPEDTKYRDRKLQDMNRRLDNLYDTIYELEDKIEEAYAKRKSIEMSAITIDNVYKVLLNFDKVYDRLNDEEKKTMIQGFIKEIQIYPKEEQAKYEHPIRNITFNFPIIINGEEVDKISWENGNTVETVVLLSKGEVDSKKIRVEFSLEDMDMSEFQDGATYTQIKDYVLEHSGLKVSNLYISQIKRKCGIGVGKNYNLPKSEDSRQPQCPPEKEKAIREAFKYFGMI